MRRWGRGARGRRKALLPDPAPEEGPVDLYAPYDRTRRLTFGALIPGLLAFRVVGMVRWAGGAFPEAGPMTVWSVLKSVPWAFCLGYGVLIVVRRRWVNGTLLAAGLVYDGWSVLPMRLGE
jgi:hypothetical protein